MMTPHEQTQQVINYLLQHGFERSTKTSSWCDVLRLDGMDVYIYSESKAQRGTQRIRNLKYRIGFSGRTNTLRSRADGSFDEKSIESKIRKAVAKAIVNAEYAVKDKARKEEVHKKARALSDSVNATVFNLDQPWPRPCALPYSERNVRIPEMLVSPECAEQILRVYFEHKAKYKE